MWTSHFGSSCRRENMYSTSVLLLVLFAVASLSADTQDDLLNAQKGQEYWRKSGHEDIENSLNARRALNEGIAKNAILFVGDGMGPNTITAARVFRGGETSSLSFENFPHMGLLKTYAADATIPDSACTATALFSGVKANFETIGLDAGAKLADCEASLDKAHHLNNIIQWAQDAGKSTGFVTTTRVTHATPASVYSHSADRRWECEQKMPASASKCKDIGRQLVEDLPGANLQVIMGGGRQCLQSGITGNIDTWACFRQDGRDLIQTWKDDKTAKNTTWAFVENTEQLQKLAAETEYVMGIFSNSHLPFEDQREDSNPSLSEMTEAAIKILSKNPNGYVLIVEGGMIDQAHHRGFVRRALVETVEFHKAIEMTTNLTNEKDTLIVVTSDHAHSLTINGYTDKRNDILGITRPSKVDGVPFNILSYMVGGPNNFPYTVVDGQVKRNDPTSVDSTAPDYAPQSGLLTDEANHGGVDVPVFAKGPMAHLFHRVHEQSYVAHVIAYSAAIGDYTGRSGSSINLPLFLLSPLLIVFLRHL